jgi:hypothetical protein
MTELIWSFAPWIVFLLTARLTNVGVAIGAGALAAVVVLARAIAKGRVHVLDGASLAYFAGLAALVVATRPTDLDHWAAYAQAGSHLVLMTVVCGSILIGRPFTEAYARETTPQEYWDSQDFHQTNMRISAAWGAAFVVGFVSLVLAATTNTLPFLLRIAVPFGSLYAAYQFTDQQRQAADTSGVTGPSAAAGPAGPPRNGIDA